MITNVFKRSNNVLSNWLDLFNLHAIIYLLVLQVIISEFEIKESNHPTIFIFMKDLKAIERSIKIAVK